MQIISFFGSRIAIKNFTLSTFHDDVCMTMSPVFLIDYRSQGQDDSQCLLNYYQCLLNN